MLNNTPWTTSHTKLISNILNNFHYISNRSPNGCAKHQGNRQVKIILILFMHKSLQIKNISLILYILKKIERKRKLSYNCKTSNLLWCYNHKWYYFFDEINDTIWLLIKGKKTKISLRFGLDFLKISNLLFIFSFNLEG